jgi:transposase-like protein
MFRAKTKTTHDPFSLGRSDGNTRNSQRAKTILTDTAEAAIEVPRDRDGSCVPFSGC